MSVSPRAHVYLKDAFLYYDRRRIYLEGGRSWRLSRTDRAILECLERAESELSVLAHALSRFAIGGEPSQIAATLVETLGVPASVLEIGEPLDVIEPQVIVCSFAPDGGGFDPRPLVRQLRKRMRVLHIGLKQYVGGDPKANVCFESLQKAGRFRSSFHFVQWARSLVRFHTRSVLVLTAVQDLILFGDLAATHRSFVYINPRWPGAIQLENLLAGQAFPRDPTGSIQAVFYAVRMLSVSDYAHLDLLSCSDLSTLFHYGLREASVVTFSTADQLESLRRLGRSADSCMPMSVAKNNRLLNKEPDGTLALVLDYQHLGAAASVIGALNLTLPQAGLKSIRLRVESNWLDVRFEGENLVVSGRRADQPPPRPSAVIVFPGLTRYLHGAVELQAAGVPLLFYPTEHAHPLLDGPADPRIVFADTASEWAQVLREAIDPSSNRHRALIAKNQELLSAWEATTKIASLLAAAMEPVR